MAFIDAIMARVADQVPELAGRIEGAANLAEMVRTNKLPQVTPALNVMPLGVIGGKPISMLKNYRQDVDRQFALVLTIQTYEAQGARAQPDIEALIERLVTAIVGWTPQATTRGVFRLIRWWLVNIEGGALSYQIEVAIADAIRSQP